MASLRFLFWLAGRRSGHKRGAGLIHRERKRRLRFHRRSRLAGVRPAPADVTLPEGDRKSRNLASQLTPQSRTPMGAGQNQEMGWA